jgi:hypothetical protein
MNLLVINSAANSGIEGTTARKCPATCWNIVAAVELPIRPGNIEHRISICASTSEYDQFDETATAAAVAGIFAAAEDDAADDAMH